MLSTILLWGWRHVLLSHTLGFYIQLISCFSISFKQTETETETDTDTERERHISISCIDPRLEGRKVNNGGTSPIW